MFPSLIIMKTRLNTYYILVKIEMQKIYIVEIYIK